MNQRKAGLISPKGKVINVENVINSILHNQRARAIDSIARMLALRMHVEGNSQRAIARIVYKRWRTGLMLM